MNTFFTSDTHYHHKNIVRGTTEWKPEDGGFDQRVRDFNTLEEHDAKLVENINKVVKAKDILYHIGDWSFGGIERVWEFRKQLECKTIHLILGNHDHHIENNRLLDIDDAIALITTESKEYREIPFPYKKPARELFASVNQRLIKKINGKSMHLDHFAHRVWEKSHHGFWHLYGHSHGTLPDYGRYPENQKEQFELELWGLPETWKHKCMDVGIDTHPEFRPYHFDEIAEIMKDRINLKIDHHSEKTN